MKGEHTKSELPTEEQNIEEPPVMGKGDGPAPLPTERDRRESWLRLYRQRFINVAHFTEAQANDATQAVCTGPDDDVGFLELSEGWENDPEGAADEEMSYWDDDGE